VIAAFDPAVGELPEGLAIDPRGARALVGFAPTGAVVSVDLDSGAVAPHGKLPTPPPNNAGFMTGFAVDADGDLLAALVSFDPSVQAGIYRVPASGGDATLHASDPGMLFPNGIVALADGGLLVTDSGAGAIFHVSAAGAVTSWLADELLTGQLDFCGPGLGTFDIGANGIALRGTDVLVANNDRGSIVRIPIDAEGNAGTAELEAGPDCDLLGGADGIVVDADGSVLVAVNRQNRIARVSGQGAISVVAEGGVLDFPASLAIRERPERSLLITSFALGAALAGGDPQPALVELALP
jgi:sugar lactone lactonase YvrE